MQSVIVLTARMSKDGTRILCGNRQCRHAGLAEIARNARSGSFSKVLRLAKGFDRRRDGIYAFTKRSFERTPQAFKGREGLRTNGLCHTTSKPVVSLADLGLVKRSQDYQEQPQLLIPVSDLYNAPIEVRCPRCHNCSLITSQVVEGGMPAKK